MDENFDDVRYAQAEIDELVSCPKKVISKPKKEMTLEKGSYRNDMKLQSVEKERSFSVFMRRNAMFPENFSIGLTYEPKNKPNKLCLVRCNGPHGVHISINVTHISFHIHKAAKEAKDMLS